MTAESKKQKMNVLCGSCAPEEHVRDGDLLLTRNCLASLVTYLGMSTDVVHRHADDVQHLVWVISNTATDRQRLKRASMCLMTLGSRECPNELMKLLYEELHS